MYCNCSNVGSAKSDIGYHRREDGVWTHALCDRPTRLYLTRRIELVPTDLNLFQGGPIHNAMFENSEIISRSAILAKENGQHLLDHIDDYRWTEETLTGQSGRVARIWRMKEESSTTEASTMASASSRSSRAARSRASKR